MEEQQLSQEQQQSRSDQLERGTAFEELVTSKGWAYVKAHYEQNVKALATEMMTTSTPLPLGFEARRQQLMGIRQLLGSIQSDLDALTRYRKEQREQTPGPTSE